MPVKKAPKRESRRCGVLSNVSTLVVLRDLDLVLCLASIFTLSYKVEDDPWSGYDISTPSVFVNIPIVAGALLDIADLVTIYIRRGRGVTPKAQIGIEIVVLLGMLVNLALYIFRHDTDSLAYGVSEALVGVIGTFLGIIICFHAYFFTVACITRHKEVKGDVTRVVYVPDTKQVFLVVSKRPRILDSIFLSQQLPRSSSGSHFSKPRSSDTTPRKPLNIEYPAHEPPFTLEPNLIPAVMTPPAPKPTPAPTPYPVSGQTPPQPDYVPDEAELERRRRGDAQPQLISPQDLGLKFGTSMTGMTPMGEHAMDSKFLAFPFPIKKNIVESNRRMSI